MEIFILFMIACLVLSMPAMFILFYFARVDVVEMDIPHEPQRNENINFADNADDFWVV